MAPNRQPRSMFIANNRTNGKRDNATFRPVSIVFQGFSTLNHFENPDVQLLEFASVECVLNEYYVVNAISLAGFSRISRTFPARRRAASQCRFVDCAMNRARGAAKHAPGKFFFSRIRFFFDVADLDKSHTPLIPSRPAVKDIPHGVIVRVKSTVGHVYGCCESVPAGGAPWVESPRDRYTRALALVFDTPLTPENTPCRSPI